MRPAVRRDVGVRDPRPSRGGRSCSPGTASGSSRSTTRGSARPSTSPPRSRPCSPCPGSRSSRTRRSSAASCSTAASTSAEQTFFRQISRLPPAHDLTVRLDATLALSPRRYWRYPPEEGRLSEPEAAAKFRELLEDSVRIHARSDVPVGTCLSGGLDSSSIVCLAEQLRADGQIPRYTHSAFGYLPQDEAFSERRHMQSVVDSDRRPDVLRRPAGGQVRRRSCSASSASRTSPSARPASPRSGSSSRPRAERG